MQGLRRTHVVVDKSYSSEGPVQSSTGALRYNKNVGRLLRQIINKWLLKLAFTYWTGNQAILILLVFLILYIYTWNGWSIQI